MESIASDNSAPIPSRDEIRGLKAEVYRFVAAHPTGVSEYQILKITNKYPLLAAIPTGGWQALFQRHFILMHVLYLLQREALLDISEAPLKIKPCLRSHDSDLRIADTPTSNKLHTTTKTNTSSDGTSLDQLDPLESFYLDWNQFQATSEEQIHSWLDNFWQQYNSFEKRDAALSVLGLGAEAKPAEIQASYRLLVKKHHPDQGGDGLRFIEVQQAWEILQSHNWA